MVLSQAAAIKRLQQDAAGELVQESTSNRNAVAASPSAERETFFAVILPLRERPYRNLPIRLLL